MILKRVSLSFWSVTAVSRGGGSSEQGFSIVEALIAALIIAVAGAGLGTSLVHLSHSRQKSQLISQAVGVEAALVSALQDPNTYSATANPSSATALTAIKNGAVVTTPVDVTVTPDPTQPPFHIFSGGAPVYLDDKDNALPGPGGNWAIKVALSNVNLNPATNLYSYAYNIQVNPALANVAQTGATNIAPPAGSADLNVVIPPQTLSVANQTQAACLPAATYLAMLGLDQGGNPICVERAQNKCLQNYIAKGFQLIQQGPNLYSYEFTCMKLRSLSCPTQLTDAGVPDLTLNNPYVLQSFIPNTLDSGVAGAIAPTGQCVFMAAKSKGPIVVPLPYTNGVTVTNACPPHYIVSGINCTAGANNAQPATVVCASSDPAVPVAPSPATGMAAFVTQANPNSVTCQRKETQVCCGDNPANCAAVWTGQVNLSYSCVLNGTTAETVSAIPN